MDGANFASGDEQNDAYYDNVANNRRNYNRKRNRALARAVVAVAGHRLNTRRQSQPMHNSTLTGSISLSNLLASRGLLKTTRNMNVNEKSFIFLAICARGETNRHISYLFQHSVETTSRWFYKVLQVICSLKDEFIRPADYTLIQNLIMENSEKYRPWFDVSNVDVNADYVFNDGIDGTGPSTGSHQHDPSREAMNGMRDHIANEMWERYQVAPWYKQT
ncbi:hypothetical protein TIFTF001_047360 [Ficus carica]|uniref:DUF8040 domain-containing protein n=1 Tax=Ficus carica TaxID=3494 RepID=A0AA87YYF6_FICCA|nr:hypothetical protein TIFTF001_047345 [Ficus carica]GMN21987.1 hypothetical protein TIFTF001_047350 [Ficus carica]GMN22017.1 hypothetical protein TIFTF001_047355 [Ficus carica]GMN22024.1 hypothetical protein TIFTF001_047360 [Ficus carica]